MSIRDFAERLGVAERTVSKWEAGQTAISPRPEMQAALDTTLAMSSTDTNGRFNAMLEQNRDPGIVDGGAFGVLSHKFVPVYVGQQCSQRLMDDAHFAPHPHEWLTVSSTALPHPDGTCTAYAFACGVIVFYIRQHRQFNTLASLAAWRYGSYDTDILWAGQQVAAHLPGLADATPRYVLSVYHLEQPCWTNNTLDVALRLMCAPSALVDRRSEDQPIPVSAEAEQELLTNLFDHADITPFGIQGISIGYAAWSGLSYYALSPERALTDEELVDYELETQALWAYCQHIQQQVEDGRDPTTPSEFGWRFLRAAHSRLTTARPQETTQHHMMRRAILATSGLPERLTQAQAALQEAAPLIRPEA